MLYKSALYGLTSHGYDNIIVLINITSLQVNEVDLVYTSGLAILPACF